MLVMAHAHTELNAQVNDIMAEQEAACAADPFAYLEANLLSCLLALDAAGVGSDDQSELKRLPAIVFHLTVRGCNNLTRQLLSSLENLQDAAQARNFCLVLTGAAKCEQDRLMGVEADIVYRIRATEVRENPMGDGVSARAPRGMWCLREPPGGYGACENPTGDGVSARTPRGMVCLCATTLVCGAVGKKLLPAPYYEAMLFFIFYFC